MDFLIGFSIFLLALIMVLMMVPGIFAGLQSAKIDYDAVSYRTSVILCEDPGWPVLGTSWEQYDTAHKSEISRLGLAVSSESPNILSKQKLNAFYNLKDDLTLTEDDYRSKVIFGDLPYYYNVSLKIESDPAIETGFIAPDSSSGYMRRLVKVKEPGEAKINCGDFNKTSDYITALNPKIYTGFSVSFDYNELQNKSKKEAYRFMPQAEPATITISNFTESINRSDVTVVTLDKVRLKKNGIEVPMLYSLYHNETYRFYIDGVLHTMQGPFLITDTSEFKVEMYPPLMYSDEIGTSLSLVFNMTYEFVPDETIPHYYFSGDIPYDYTSNLYMTRPYLRDGVMEVFIW